MPSASRPVSLTPPTVAAAGEAADGAAGTALAVHQGSAAVGAAVGSAGTYRAHVWPPFDYAHLFYTMKLAEHPFVVKGAKRKLDVKGGGRLFGAQPVDEVAQLGGEPLDPLAVSHEQDSYDENR